MYMCTVSRSYKEIQSNESRLARCICESHRACFALRRSYCARRMHGSTEAEQLKEREGDTLVFPRSPKSRQLEAALEAVLLTGCRNFRGAVGELPSRLAVCQAPATVGAVPASVTYVGHRYSTSFIARVSDSILYFGGVIRVPGRKSPRLGEKSHSTPPGTATGGPPERVCMRERGRGNLTTG